MDKLNNLLSRGAEEKYNDEATNMLHLKRITLKGPFSDVLFNCDSSRCIKLLSCNSILKSLVSLAKTEKFSKDNVITK